MTVFTDDSQCVQLRCNSAKILDCPFNKGNVNKIKFESWPRSRFRYKERERQRENYKSDEFVRDRNTEAQE